MEMGSLGSIRRCLWVLGICHIRVDATNLKEWSKQQQHHHRLCISSTQDKRASNINTYQWATIPGIVSLGNPKLHFDLLHVSSEMFPDMEMTLFSQVEMGNNGTVVASPKVSAEQFVMISTHKVEFPRGEMFSRWSCISLKWEHKLRPRFLIITRTLKFRWLPLVLI